jgi:molybdopterin synthase catalytic subunit
MKDGTALQSKNDFDLISKKGGTYPQGILTPSDVLAAVAENVGEENIRQLVSYTALVQDKVPRGKTCNEVRFTSGQDSDQLLHEIASEAIQKFQLKDARLFHAIGSLKIDDDQIIAVAVGEDRKATFRAIQEMIMAAKTQANIQGVYLLANGAEVDVPP